MKLILSIIIAFTIIYLINKLFIKYWKKELSVNISFQKDVLYEDEENVLYEEILNRKKLPLPILQVKFAITRFFEFPKEETSSVTDLYYRNEFFTVKPYQKITRAHRFKCVKRGMYSIKGLDLICYSLFLGQKMISSNIFDETVYVLPRKIKHGNIPPMVTRFMGELEKNIHINDDPFTFVGIREFMPYDNMHNINWKATAKMGKPFVNIHNTTYSKNVVILLNIEKNSLRLGDEIIENCIRIASYVASFFTQNGIPFSFYANGFDIENDEIIAINNGCSLSHYRSIEIALARLDLAKGNIPFSNFLNDDEIFNNHYAEYIIISNSKKEDVSEPYMMRKKSGFYMNYISPDYDNETSSKYNIPGILNWIIPRV